MTFLRGAGPRCPTLNAAVTSFRLCEQAAYIDGGHAELMLVERGLNTARLDGECCAFFWHCRVRSIGERDLPSICVAPVC